VDNASRESEFQDEKQNDLIIKIIITTTTTVDNRFQGKCKTAIILTPDIPAVLICYQRARWGIM